MKAAVLTGIRKMEIMDMPEPAIKKENEVLLKVEAVGVCGSDVHYYETGRIGSQIIDYPFIIGHECAATVKDIGGAVTRVKVGDEVVVDPAVSCNECDQCKQERENTCRKLRFLGTPGQGDGCLCEYIVIPQNSCFPTNKTISLEQGVLCEPLAIGVYSVKNACVTESSDIAILGSGPIGLSCLVSALAENVNACYVTEKISERMKAAKRNGADWGGNPDKEDIVREILQQKPDGMDAVFECAGQQDTIDQAVELLKPGGRLVIVGIPRLERISFIIDKIRRKEITIVNIRRQNKCTQKAINLIASGKVKVDFMITHKFDLEETKQAFDIVAGYRDGVVKAIIEI